MCLNSRHELVKGWRGLKHIKHYRDLIDPVLSKGQTKTTGIYLSNYYKMIKMVNVLILIRINR